jgi:hypothetical protein
VKLARAAVLLTFLAGLYALVWFGGDQAAQLTDSRWLAALLGFVVSITYVALFFGIEKFIVPTADVGALSEYLSFEDETQQVGPFEIILALSLVVVLGLASFGHSGTPVAFLAGLFGGLLIAAVVAQRYRKPSLNYE